jgi:transcriptional regulator with XRE-family HTH domain
VIGTWRSYRDVLRALGARARQLRLIRELKQEELAARAGVGVATVQRFEKTGAASLASALRIATALHADAGFERLFEAPPYASIDEALARPEASTRVRIRRRGLNANVAAVPSPPPPSARKPRRKPAR